jgi:polyisoprenoid-binding protein YceI
MKTYKQPKQFPILIALWMVIFALLAFKPMMLPDHEVQIKGTSSLHDWVADVQKIEVKIDAQWNENGLQEIKKAEVIIPVKSIESGKDLMNTKLYDALKADKHPNIRFEMMEVVSLSTEKVTVKGRLHIAGESKVVNLSAELKQDQEGYFLQGSYGLKMTEYKVVPPTAMMGTIKTGDEIVIEYKAYLNEQLIGLNK